MIQLKPIRERLQSQSSRVVREKGEFELAKKAYEDGLKVDAANDTCKDGIKECEQKLSGDDEVERVYEDVLDPQLLGKLAA